MACPKIEKYSACKDPDSIVDYGRNWGENIKGPGWLGEDEVIIESEWEITSVTEETPTLVVSTSGTVIAIDGKSTLIWLEGGTVGFNYNLLNRITTNEGRVEERTGIISIAEK